MLKILKIRVTPRSSKNEIVGPMADGTLKIKLKSPPVDGKANEELIKFLSEHYGIPRSRVAIIKGTTRRNKVVEMTEI